MQIALALCGIVDRPTKTCVWIHLSGTGDDFCSGFDRGGSDERPRAGATQRPDAPALNRLIPSMLELPCTIVASVSGWVAGLGMDLALAADFARLRPVWGPPFTGSGFTPDSGASSWLLTRMACAASRCSCWVVRPAGRRPPAGADPPRRAAADVDAEAEALVAELAGDVRRRRPARAPRTVERPAPPPRRRVWCSRWPAAATTSRRRPTAGEEAHHRVHRALIRSTSAAQLVLEHLAEALRGSTSTTSSCSGSFCFMIR